MIYLNHEEIEKLIDEGEILPLKDVKVYVGIFTGKMVKKDEEKDYGCFDKFKKGDKVIVFKLNDYNKWNKGMDLIIDSLEKTVESMKKS